MDNHINNSMNNSFQYDNNMLLNQQPSTIFPNNNSQSTMLFNQPSNFPSNNFNSQSLNNIMPIDPTILNGTNLDDDSNLMHSNRIKQDPTLIKSVAREIINGLKENNMSLYDNSSINSYKNKSVDYRDIDNDDDVLDDDDDDNYSKSSNKFNKSNKSKSKNKVKEVVETIEDFVNNKTNTTKTYSDYTGWFFDECFNYKDFLILFTLYFILSQEMIKDFFAKYFSSLNPDHEGKIGIQGVIIYGLILTVLFMVIKKIFVSTTA